MELTPEQKKRVVERFRKAEKELLALYNVGGVLMMHEQVSSIVGAYMVLVRRFGGFKSVEIAAQNLELIIDGARGGD